MSAPTETQLLKAALAVLKVCKSSVCVGESLSSDDQLQSSKIQTLSSGSPVAQSVSASYL